MQYTTLGQTGLIVSRLALGTMTFGAGFAAVQKVDQATADALVGAALDAGVNFFDTADQYSGGQAETMLGRALGARRRDVVLATKAGNRFQDTLLDAGLSARHLLNAAEASLRRLGTDYIDLYQLHMPDGRTPFDETLRALEDLARRGLVRYAGFCSLPAWQAATMLGLQRERGYAPFVSAQMYYSLLGRDIEHEIVPLVQHAGLALLAWSPLAGGFLSGKYSRASAGAAGDRRATFDFPPIDHDLGYAVLDRLEALAAALGGTVAQMALAWLLAQPHVTGVIAGATRLEQLQANLGAAEVRLPAEALAELDALTRPAEQYPNWMITRMPDTTAQQALQRRAAAGPP
jgi:aryl-alcohol dehydrogenase-like predicted oxidoreductase